MVVNMFIASSGLQLMISIVGVLIFAGLTPYDTQQIKLMYAEREGSETAAKKAVIDALKL